MTTSTTLLDKSASYEHEVETISSKSGSLTKPDGEFHHLVMQYSKPTGTWQAAILLGNEYKQAIATKPSETRISSLVQRFSAPLQRDILTKAIDFALKLGGFIELSSQSLGHGDQRGIGALPQPGVEPLHPVLTYVYGYRSCMRHVGEVHARRNVQHRHAHSISLSRLHEFGCESAIFQGNTGQGSYSLGPLSLGHSLWACFVIGFSPCFTTTVPALQASIAPRRSRHNLCAARFGARGCVGSRSFHNN